MSETDILWQLLLEDFKRARTTTDSDTLYALADAWTAYIRDIESVSPSLTGESE